MELQITPIALYSKNSQGEALWEQKNARQEINFWRQNGKTRSGLLSERCGQEDNFGTLGSVSEVQSVLWLQWSNCISARRRGHLERWKVWMLWPRGQTLALWFGRQGDGGTICSLATVVWIIYSQGNGGCTSTLKDISQNWNLQALGWTWESSTFLFYPAKDHRIPSIFNISFYLHLSNVFLIKKHLQVVQSRK